MSSMVRVINDPNRDVAASLGRSLRKGIADALSLVSERTLYRERLNTQVRAQADLMTLAHKQELEKIAY